MSAEKAAGSFWGRSAPRVGPTATGELPGSVSCGSDAIADRRIAPVSWYFERTAIRAPRAPARSAVLRGGWSADGCSPRARRPTGSSCGRTASLARPDPRWSRGDSEHLAHVHVLGLELEQVGQRFRHGLEAATEVEPHRVLRRCRGDDHLGVAAGPRSRRAARTDAGRHPSHTPVRSRGGTQAAAIPGRRWGTTTPMPTSRSLAKAPTAIPPSST